MNINVGDVVVVKHYTILNPFLSYVSEIGNDNIKVKVTKEFPDNNIFIGEPIVLGYENEEKVFVLGCDIMEVDIESNTVTLSFDHEDSFVNLRSRERFPVSLYAEMISDKFKKQLIIVKDLSLFGMRIYSKSDLQLNEIVEINFYTEKDVIFIKGKIVRENESTKCKEYGVGIIYENNKAMNLVEIYLNRLKSVYEQQIKKLKFEF